MDVPNQTTEKQVQTRSRDNPDHNQTLFTNIREKDRGKINTYIAKKY